MDDQDCSGFVGRCPALAGFLAEPEHLNEQALQLCQVKLAEVADRPEVRRVIVNY